MPRSYKRREIHKKMKLENRQKCCGCMASWRTWDWAKLEVGFLLNDQSSRSIAGTFIVIVAVVVIRDITHFGDMGYYVSELVKTTICN